MRLNKGDKIGIFTPSSPASVTAKKRYKRAKSFLEYKGFQIVEGFLTGKSDFYRSGNPKERAEELNELLRDPSIKMIMSMIGGTNSNSLLPYIDYESFKKNPKIVVGYSDATAILLALYAKTGISTYYGPALVPSFGEFEPLVNDTYQFFENYFCKEQKLPYEIQQPFYWSDEMANWLDKIKEKELYTNEWIGVNGGVVEGRLVGGNNNAMYGFIGTQYFPEIKEGDILFLEDTMKTASVVEKNFAMLKLHGIFDKVSGIILGKHEQYDDMDTGRKPLDILLEQLDNRIPILAEFDTSHTHPMHPICIGKKIRMDTNIKKVWCTEKWELS
ncbi:S66 family peptidase (plasmid) [Niallia taxi]|uniref:LD-carboxypeptidase n=1 Tax=Niallia taxi TaxID=2499688 RepID=A0A3S2TRB0_9BACI|nr:S66 peptidase family protein [Niallia taxi]MDK8643317.1 LD-carboxypeptidase [Niallia taxi]MED4055176.1 LD-carboxypeptidase [Niallia taxi]RVT57033.1 LD-carboxypeptidase [Niallia taxi]